MSAPSRALRLRRPPVKDPRLIIGVLLVIVSIVAGAVLFARMSHTVTVFVARDTILPGQTLHPDQFTTRDVRLDDGQSAYVLVGEDIPQGAVATRMIGAGELIPRGAVGQAEVVDLRPVTIPVDPLTAKSVTAGSRVEVWRTVMGDNQNQPPEVSPLLENAYVRSVDDTQSMGARTVTVELLVPKGDVPAVLEAIAAQQRLDVLVVPGGMEVQE